MLRNEMNERIVVRLSFVFLWKAIFQQFLHRDESHEAGHREKSALRRLQLRNEEEITARESRHYTVRRPR